MKMLNDNGSRRIFLLATLLFKDLLRRRLTLLILFIVPLVFNLVILVITSDTKDPIVFGILPEDSVRMISRQALSFVFMGCAAVAFLTSFLAFNLVFKRSGVDQRLAGCGFRPAEIIASKIILLIALILVIAVYESLMLSPFVNPLHYGRFLLGFILAGTIYCSYGLFIGSISRHELEGIFLIILVANVDIGWLQNPLYFYESTNQQVIKLLPGFCPTQLANLGAFTHEFRWLVLWGSLAYIALFLSLAMIAFRSKIRLREGLSGKVSPARSSRPT